MKRWSWKQAGVLVSLETVALGSCAAPPPPPPAPPPPPPVVVVIPPKPVPPMGASPSMAIPPTDANGLRLSVNRNITPAQMVWNLRSAYNVAALNCRKPEHADIIVNYRAFLKDNEKTLRRYNRLVDAEFKAKYGKGFIVPRETYMTEVYNHFALPPTVEAFCTAVQVVSRDGATVSWKELEPFAARSLPSIEVVFDDFYRRYAAYRAELAAWEARYAPPAQVSGAGSAVVAPAIAGQATGPANSPSGGPAVLAPAPQPASPTAN
ncbi:MAG: hypothetical protein V4579_11680 [Pseudomonadota bacterium]